MTIVSVDCSTRKMNLLLQKSTFCQGASRSLQRGKAFIKQTTFLNYDVYMLTSVLTELCRHTFSVLEHIMNSWARWS